MGGNDGDEAVPLVSVTKDFGETYAEVQAWAVPESDRYPDGVKYSMQYGTTDGEKYSMQYGTTDGEKYSMQYGTTDGETVIRYDNFPDHPGAAPHHKHLSDGTVEDIQFPGLEELFDRFTEEVETYGEHW